MLTLKRFPLTWKAANQHKFSPILLFSHLNMHFVTIQQHHAKSTFSLAVSAKSWTQYYFKNWFSISGSFEIPWFNSCGGSQQLPTRSRVPSPVLCTWTYRTRLRHECPACRVNEGLWRISNWILDSALRGMWRNLTSRWNYDRSDSGTISDRSPDLEIISTSTDTTLLCLLGF